MFKLNTRNYDTKNCLSRITDSSIHIITKTVLNNTQAILITCI